MRRRTFLSCAALAAAIAVCGDSGRAGWRQSEWLQDGAALDAQRREAGGGDHAAPDRRGRPPERLSLRGHPGRDLRAHAGSGQSRPLREPRDQQGAVPVQRGGAYGGQRGERLRQRAGEPADPQPAVGGGAQRLVRHREQLRLPALLLQLPRDEGGGVQEADPVHERGVRRTTCTGRRRPGRPRPGAPAEEEAGLVVALDVKTGKHRPIYGMGRHNHENSVAIPGYGQPVVFSGDDTFTSGPLTDPLNPSVKLAPAQSQLYSYIARARTSCWPTRETSGPSSPTRRASRTTTTSPPDRGPRSAGTSSRCRRTSPPASTPTARS